ncbi:MAG: hypothetical protein M0Z29_02515 [Actinomycetota bacterium]|nr:hypothetical protein [Actinomycetota bacterium]
MKSRTPESVIDGSVTQSSKFAISSRLETEGMARGSETPEGRPR